MVKHIVLWRLKEIGHGNTKATNAQLMKEKLEYLNGQIDGLIKVEVGIDLIGGLNYDVALLAELESIEALAIYQEHPLHQAVLPFIREVIEDRKAIDYETEE